MMMCLSAVAAVSAVSCGMGSEDNAKQCACWPGFTKAAGQTSCMQTNDGYVVAEKGKWMPTSGKHEGDGYYLVELDSSNTANARDEIVGAYWGRDFMSKTADEKESFWSQYPAQTRGLFWLAGNPGSLGGLVSFKAGESNWKQGTSSLGGPLTKIHVFDQKQWSFANTPRGKEQFHNEMKMFSQYLFNWDEKVENAVVSPVWYGLSNVLSSITLKFSMTLKEPCLSNPNYPSCKWDRATSLAGNNIDNYAPTRIIDEFGKRTPAFANWTKDIGTTGKEVGSKNLLISFRCVPAQAGGNKVCSYNPAETNTLPPPTSNALPRWVQEASKSKEVWWVVIFAIVISVFGAIGCLCKCAHHFFYGGKDKKENQQPVNQNNVETALS